MKFVAFCALGAALSVWAADPSGTESASSYLLNTGDVIDLKFSYNPEMNDRITVRPDGAVSLPLIGDVRVAKLTPTALSKRLTERYGNILRHPEVVVMVRDFGTQRAYIGGEVYQPGLVPLRGEMSCLQAVMSGGGPKPTAKTNKVLLIRYREGDEPEVRQLNLKQIMAGKAADVLLRPYDVVYLPRTNIAKVGLFVEQYVNSMLPRNIVFPYNLNSSASVSLQ